MAPAKLAKVMLFTDWVSAALCHRGKMWKHTSRRRKKKKDCKRRVQRTPRCRVLGLLDITLYEVADFYHPQGGCRYLRFPTSGRLASILVFVREGVQSSNQLHISRLAPVLPLVEGANASLITPQRHASSTRMKRPTFILCSTQRSS